MRDLRPAGLLAAAIFTVGMVVVAAGGGLRAQMAVVEALALGVRAALYGAALVAVGGVVFLTVVHDGQPGEAARLRRVVRAAAGVGLLATVLAVPLHAAVITGAGYAGLADTRALGVVLASPFGVAAGLRGCGLAGVALAAGRRGWAATAVWAGTLLVLVPFALTGHAATADPRWLVAGSALVHAAAAGVWLGGLVALTIVLRLRRASRDPVGGAQVIGRFSTVAGASIAALVPTGTLLGIVEVGSAAGLVTSGYGRALLVKVALVAAVIGIGAYNRWRLVPAVTRDAPGSWARLGRTVRWELTGLLAVVLVTGLLARLAAPA